MAKVMNWEKAAKFCEETFGSYVDWEERFFHCPDCGEPLLFEDWEDHDFEICPICEFNFEEDAE